MSVTPVDAFALPPPAKPERAAPRDDSDFARELESSAREETPRRPAANEAERADESARPTETPARPSTEKAPTEAAAAQAGPSAAEIIASPELAASLTANGNALGEAPLGLQPQSATGAAGQPAGDAAQPAVQTPAEPTGQLEGAQAEPDLAAHEDGAAQRAETSKWSFQDFAKPAAAPTTAATAATANAGAQTAFGAGERLAAVKVLRQIEATPAEAKQAPPPLASAGNHNLAAAAAAPSAFETHLASAESAGATVGSSPAAAARAAAAPTPASQVAVQLAQAVEDGVRRLEIRLSPAELGRVEVKLDVAHDGRVLAVVAADRQDTLDLLQRDARELERALQEAGIRADGGSLSFTLRQQERQAWAGSEPHAGGAHLDDGDASPTPAALAARPRASLRALDISV